jgi:hypothetical protein
MKIMLGRNEVAVVCALVAGALGCSSAPEEALGTTREEANVELSQHALSFKYLAVDSPLPAGVAAGEKVVFVGDPLLGRVLEYSRLTGRQIGELPAPPGGFVLPFMMKHISRNQVAILDAGGFPSPLPLVPANPTIYEYSYSSNGRSVNATLTRSIPFSSALIGFAEDIVLLPDGRYLLADAVLGGIWIANTDGSISPGIVARSSAPADAIPELSLCPTMPEVEVGGVPFLFGASTVPGITTITERDGIVYFASACRGAVYKVPVGSLRDTPEP